MTECERIISEGIVSSDFLKEEVRERYTVSRLTKKVWAIYLDLYRKFSSICDKYCLRYWAACGTLLGAARHKGFIPWDDDFDVMMPRSDYDKLLSLDLKLEEPYCLQTTLNDNDYYCVYARLRNSNTTGILVSGNNKCNNGIYIDIIPIDGLDENASKQQARALIIKARNVLSHAYLYDINPRLVAKVAHRILRLPFIPFDYRKEYKKVQAACRSVAWNESQKVGFILLLGTYSFTSSTFDKTWFSDTTFLPFEKLSIPVPIGYKHILETLYGDYMLYPPEEKRGDWHDFYFEPDIPYNKFQRG